MPLPAPKARTHLHTRAVVFRGYHRADGLWDIEAELTDTKTYALEPSERGDMPPGTPIHGMAIRATVDDNMTIREIASSSDHAPFGECQQGTEPMQQMVGVTYLDGRKIPGLGSHIRPFPFTAIRCAGKPACPSLKMPGPLTTWANVSPGISTGRWCSGITPSLRAGSR